MEGIYAARAVPDAGQLVEMAGLDACNGVVLLAFAGDDGAHATNKHTRQPASNESKMREERAANIVFSLSS